MDVRDNKVNFFIDLTHVSIISSDEQLTADLRKECPSIDIMIVRSQL